MICKPWRLRSISSTTSQEHPDHKAHDASTISLPQGEMDAEPTGLSNRKDAFSPNVGLSKADSGPLEPELPSMSIYDRVARLPLNTSMASSDLMICEPGLFLLKRMAATSRWLHLAEYS